MLFDVDGVLTDGMLYLGDKGELMKAFNARDGHGLKMLAESGLPDFEARSWYGLLGPAGLGGELPLDGEGRVVLPDEFIASATLTDQAAFVGRGWKFQIWEPSLLASAKAGKREQDKPP